MASLLTFESKHILFLCLFILGFKFIRAETEGRYMHHICLQTGNYSRNSSYETNLKLLMSTLPEQASVHAFYNNTSGNGTDKVYTIFLCRGDVTNKACQECVKMASNDILEKCPNQMEAIIWYQTCMLRFANRSIFAKEENVEGIYRKNSDSPDRPTSSDFNRTLGLTAEKVINAAAYGSGDGGVRFFATESGNFSSLQKLYCLAQCTPDITPGECDKCLRIAFTYLAVTSYDSVYQSSCQFRFDIVPFYEVNVSKIPPPPPSSSSPPQKGGNSSAVLVVVPIAVVAAVLFFSGCAWLFLRRKKLTKTQRNFDDSLPFDFETIRNATNNFSDLNKLGQGGFGVVYKGNLLNGQEIAVKRLSENSGQGDEEFKNEINFLAKLQHRNLVKLLGYSLEGNEKLIVYEYLPNTSLDRALFGSNHRAYLDWQTRYKIVHGIARGLLYLHVDSRVKIIHRDLKSSNILLDAEMDAKIADFGLARLFNVNQTQGVTRRVVGTFGYMAPEYLETGQFSEKSDVFSFGIILLEIVTGQKNNRFYISDRKEDLLRYAWNLWNEGRTQDLMDSTLQTSYISSEVIKCVHIGLLCVQEDATIRPTMSTVVVLFNSNSVTLPSPSTPAFSSFSPNDYNYSGSKEQHFSATTSGYNTSTNADFNSKSNSQSEDVLLTDLYPR